MTQAPPEAPQAPQPPMGPAPNPGKGLGIAGMILGIVALVLFCIWYVAIPCAIVGLILSLIGKKKSKEANAPTGMATAGLILSVIALAFDLLIAILAIVGIAVLSSAAKDPNWVERMQNIAPLLRF